MELHTIWLARGWLRRADGGPYLSADGYVVRVSEMGPAWQFELRAIGAKEVIRSGRGLAPTEDARLDAFDAITELLHDRA